MSVIPTSSVVVVAVEGIVVGVDLDAEDIFEARTLLDDVGVVVGGGDVAPRVDHLDEHADGGGGEVGQGEAEAVVSVRISVSISCIEAPGAQFNSFVEISTDFSTDFSTEFLY